jgi:hypothetical protein
MNGVKDYTEVSVPREVKKKIQILAACQKKSEDKAFEQLIRYGLEAYLAEQTALAVSATVSARLSATDATVSLSSSVPSPNNKKAIRVPRP